MTVTTAAAGRIALLALSCSLFAARAEAAPVAIDEREVEARRDFAEGRYKEAIHLFAELYAQSADPIHLRNIGRCYQKMRRPDEAIANFHDYLAKARLTADERKEIESYIDEMEALRRKRGSGRAEPTPDATVAAVPAPTSPPPVASPSVPVGPAVAAAPVAPAPVGASTTIAVEPESRAPLHGGGRPGFRTAGIVVGATGAVLLATGVVFGLATRNASNEVSHDFNPNRDLWGPRYEALQFVGYAAGAIGLLTGASLYWYGSESRETAPPTTARVTAAINPWPATLLVEGRF